MATVNNRKTVLGNAQVEILHLTSVTSGDTVSTNMQNPAFAFAIPNKNAAAARYTLTAISGKVITITNADLAADTLDLVVVGF